MSRRTTAPSKRTSSKETLLSIKESCKEYRAMWAVTAREVLEEARRVDPRIPSRETELAVTLASIEMQFQVELFWIKTEVSGV